MYVCMHVCMHVCMSALLRMDVMCIVSVTSVMYIRYVYTSVLCDRVKDCSQPQYAEDARHDSRGLIEVVPA